MLPSLGTLSICLDVNQEVFFYECRGSPGAVINYMEIVVILRLDPLLL
jgi:hypothetical protein